MKFRCACCHATLSTRPRSEEGRNEVVAFPWYRDNRNLNHLGVVCLHCGTIHDAHASIVNTILSPITGNPLRVISSVTPFEIGHVLLNAGRTADARDALKEIFSVPDWIIDILVEKRLLGGAYKY